MLFKNKSQVQKNRLGVIMSEIVLIFGKCGADETASNNYFAEKK